MELLIIGAGSFGTSIAQQLAMNSANHIKLLFQREESAAFFNKTGINTDYFPNRRLNESIEGVSDWKVVANADVIFLAVPAGKISEIISSLKVHLKPETLIVNLAKGIYSGGQTIVELLMNELEHANTVTLKGASFSAEMINLQATLLTLGFSNRKQLNILKSVTDQTNIFLDYTFDIRGVEILSALKNIYAIILGNVDARFNSANTRFMVLTKAFSEIKLILKHLGGHPDTLSLGCGVGDINLTALNDLSRNRTLGLMIGKGFYSTNDTEHSVVLEGVKTLRLIEELIPENLNHRLPMLERIKDFFLNKNDKALNIDFDELFKKRYKTVLTYGTFDLLHFGHLEILRRAKDLGDQLIVGLSTDEFNLTKGKVCKFTYQKRKEFLESLSYVDMVIPENNWEQKKEDVLNFEADIFVMGSDWEGKFDFLKEFCEVYYLPRTKGISTTKLKSIL